MTKHGIKNISAIFKASAGFTAKDFNLRHKTLSQPLAGMGIIGAIRIIVFDKKLGTIQYSFIALIFIGAIGLKLTTKA